MNKLLNKLKQCDGRHTSLDELFGCASCALLFVCQQCGSDLDLLTGFTDQQVCGNCTRKNHGKVTGK